MEQEILAWDFGVSVAEMTEIVSFCGRLNLLQINEKQITCQSLTDRLSDLIEKRDRERKRVSVAEKPQSKVKEIKGKKIEEKENYSTIERKQKMRAIDTKWQFLVEQRNNITGRNDLMDKKTKEWFYNFIEQVDIEDRKKRTQTFVEAIDLIETHKLEKFMFQNIQQYSIGNFITNINIFADGVEIAIKSIVNKDYKNKVLRIINKQTHTDPPPVDSEPVDKIDKQDAKAILEKTRNALQGK